MTSQNTKSYHENSLQNEIWNQILEPNTTIQEVITKIQEQGGLQLSQVSLSMVKNSCKYRDDFTHFLLEDTSENISVEVESGHQKDRITDGYYTNLLFEKNKLTKLKDEIVSEIKLKQKP